MSDTPRTDAAAFPLHPLVDGVGRIQHVVDREFARAQELALVEAFGCFDAAEREGWAEALDNGDIDRIRDLWCRRISYARAAIERATQP